MTIIKIYDKNFIGNAQRNREEEKLFSEGYEVKLEEEIKQGGGGCLTALIFWPLLFVKYTKIKVTYEKEG